MFICLFWVVLLLYNKNRNLAKNYLAILLFLSAVNYFVHAAFFNRQYTLYAFTENIWVFTSLASFPLYYYYIRLLTRDVRINLGWSWILLPALLLSVFSFIIYFAMSPEELDIFIRGVMYHEEGYNTPYPQLVKLQVLRINLFKVVFPIQIILLILFGSRLIIQYNNKVKEFYSNTVGKDLTPIKWLLFAFLFASIVSFASSIVGKDFFINKGLLICLPSITHSLFLFFIGHIGFYQDFTIGDFYKDVEYYRKEKVKIAAKRKELELNDKITMQQLSDLMSQKELYKNPELRITDIALIIGTNRTYISRIVNEEIHTNFCDWVNGFRIEYVKEIMNNSEYDNLSIQQIGEMAGFSSSSTFYRVFKEKEGIAPGECRENIGF
jgi:AraC-like DNA-binding protein